MTCTTLTNVLGQQPGNEQGQNVPRSRRQKSDIVYINEKMQLDIGNEPSKEAAFLARIFHVLHGHAPNWSIGVTKKAG